jgi:D-serine deaminase-like pyridoxal phosphate-dependent protein
VRPHAKTHKSVAIALRQIAQGAVGQCVQKVGDAEALVRGGVTDVLVSNEVVGDRKLRRLAALARDATIALCFDSPEQVDAASRVAKDFDVKLGGLVEIEVGMERCGVAPGKDAAVLARRIADRISNSAGCKPITAARSTWRHTSSAPRRSHPRWIPSARRSTP